MNSETEEKPKRYVVCSDCLTVNHWTQEEFRKHPTCQCGCAVWAHDRDLGEARKMAIWSKRMCGF